MIWGFLCFKRVLVFCAVFSDISSFAIISLGKRELVVLLCLSSWCHMAAVVLCLFLIMLWVGLRSVIVTFPGHTHGLKFKILKLFLYYQINSAEPKEMLHVSPSVILALFV